MKQSTFFASTVLPLLAAADGWPFDGMPDCANSCMGNRADYRPSDFCNTDATNDLSSCINGSDCGDGDKSTALQSVAQFCANRDATITAAPYPTVTGDGGRPWNGQWGSWASEQSVQWSTWADEHESAWESWTSAASFTAWPTDDASWNSLTSAHPLPSGVPVWGWHGGDGPFGRGGPDGDGWGNGPWAQGSWTTGAWTNWWGTPGCPPSTWTGWTAGPWTVNAPWTTWTACTAETTATSVFTTTITENGTPTATVTTTYGYARVAEATTDATASDSDSDDSDSDATSTSEGVGARQTQFAIAGSAAGVFGILAGAVFL